MRSAKEADVFPYRMKTICYFTVDACGTVTQIPHGRRMDFEEVVRAYRAAVGREVTLYAVWPGNWSSDLFIIDDLSAFAEAFGITED